MWDGMVKILSKHYGKIMQVNFLFKKCLLQSERVGRGDVFVGVYSAPSLAKLAKYSQDICSR